MGQEGEGGPGMCRRSLPSAAELADLYANVAENCRLIKTDDKQIHTCSMRAREAWLITICDLDG